MQDMGKKPPGLQRRGNVWQVRRRVPDEIRHIIGKTEILKSLGTGDLNLAKELFAQINAEIETEFGQARRSLSPQDPEKLTKEMAIKFAKSWFATDLDRSADEIFEILEEEISLERLGELKGELEEEERQLMSGRTEEVMPSLQAIADKILVANGFLAIRKFGSGANKKRRTKQANVDKSSDGYWSLINMVRRGYLEGVRRQIAVLKGEPASVYDNAFSELDTVNDQETDQNQVTLSELIELYLAADKTRSKRTILDMRAAFRPMLEVLGPDALIRDISRAQFREVRDLIQRLPPNAIKGKARQNKTLSEIARETEIAGEQTLHPRTVNKNVSRIAALMKWAVKEPLVKENLADDLRVPTDGAPSGKDAKDPFTMEALNSIFAEDVYRSPDVAKPSYYWAPLFSLFHGMRMEEILQLTWHDVQVEDGAKFFRLHSEGDNHLKNPNAHRNVPIHPKMDEFGFGTLMNAAEQRADGRFFPDVKRGSEGKFGSIFSKRYSAYLIRVAIKTDKTSFHSFRHTFRDAGRNCQVPEDRVQAIGGWGNGNGTDAIYGSGINMFEKAKAIALIKYPAVDFSMIKVIDWNEQVIET